MSKQFQQQIEQKIKATKEKRKERATIVFILLRVCVCNLVATCSRTFEKCLQMQTHAHRMLRWCACQSL
jgi:hypothetical protein